MRRVKGKVLGYVRTILQNPEHVSRVELSSWPADNPELRRLLVYPMHSFGIAIVRLSQ